MDRIPSPRILTLDPNDENIILEIPEDVDPNAPVTPQTKKEKVWGCEKFGIYIMCIEIPYQAHTNPGPLFAY